MLEKRDKLLDKRIEQETDKARQLLREGKKPQAALCLKRKKTLDVQRKRIQASMVNNEEMIAKFEEAALNVEVFQAQKSGAKNLKKAYGGIKPEDIDEQIADIQETMADAEDISNALAQPLGMEDDDFEDDLLALEEEMATEDMKDLDNVKIGKSELPAGKEEVANEEEATAESDDELAALEKEMIAS
eukprot:CAMPEP_0117445096 /NCGR_PEP_ID=MMETSP0759-20121206/5607_1 /TAXON_ID=63605 /ORGANISM="Percolomonas cosmopolitus, Strain WS" /LENGTH=187 /DNA_ID=CAMNT_0005237237 /DNA_START=371 /DNA_END=934 /DNA_ORIENTATION=+